MGDEASTPGNLPLQKAYRYMTERRAAQTLSMPPLLQGLQDLHLRAHIPWLSRVDMMTMWTLVMHCELAGI